MGRRWAAYTTLAGHRTDVVMAPRSTGRSGIPKKPVSERTKAFEQHDEQSHKEEHVHSNGMRQRCIIYFDTCHVHSVLTVGARSAQ